MTPLSIMNLVLFGIPAIMDAPDVPRVASRPLKGSSSQPLPAADKVARPQTLTCSSGWCTPSTGSYQ